MLTKDLIKYTRRKGYIYPKLVDIEDEESLAFAKKLIALFESSNGKTRSEIVEELLNIKASVKLDSAEGLKKLLFDRCAFRDYSEAKISEQRWKILVLAEKMRESNYFSSFEEFYELFFTSHDESRNLLSNHDLYSDLPENHKLESFETCDPKWLLNRYNVAQIQGLIFYSKWMQVRVGSQTVEERRTLLQSLRFHRLLVADLEIKENGAMEFKLDGPLALFGSARMYGSRLVNFFPRLLHSNDWSFESVVEFKAKESCLKLASSARIESYYNQLNRYVPEEFKYFLIAFKKAEKEWSIEVCREVLRLSGQNFCVPDFCFIKGGQKVYLELFHKWHQGELKKRLNHLKNIDKKQGKKLLIGMNQFLSNKVDIRSMLDGLGGIEAVGVKYRDFPHPKSVISLLNKIT